MFLNIVPTLAINSRSPTFDQHLTDRHSRQSDMILAWVTSFENDHGPSVMNHYKQHRKLNCIQKRLCCLFDEIEKVS